MSDKFKEIKRALTNPNTEPFLSYDVEELSRDLYVTTPVYTPLLDMLLGNQTRPPARSNAKIFEWTEKELNPSAYQSSKFNFCDLNPDKHGTPSRENNCLMGVTCTAKVCDFLNTLDVVGGEDSMALDMADAEKDLRRGVEWYLWNGDKTNSNPTTGDEHNGVNVLNTLTVDAGGNPLTETILQQVAGQLYKNGASRGRKFLFTTDEIAQRIANFAEDRIRALSEADLINGVPPQAMRYITSLGYEFVIVPVLAEFIGSGNAHVISPELLRLRYSSPAVLSMKPIGTVDFTEVVAFYSYFGLEMKGAGKHHIKIENISNTI